MKKLLLLALFVFAGWYGWNHYRQLRGEVPSLAVIQNEAERGMERVRIELGGHTEVREVIEPGATVVIPFHPSQSGSFQMRWNWRGTDLEKSWSGGTINPGPMPMRHRFQVMPDGVVWTSEKIEIATKKGAGAPATP